MTYQLTPDLWTVGDLFCGAGGSSQGVLASGVAKVVFCINHDAAAIRCHAQNHPDCAHYTEDIRAFNVEHLPKVDVLTVSAECTHFSIAKGGAPREADSRTLSEHVIRYIRHCEPKFVIMENVPEFLTWADLAQKVLNGIPQFRPDGSPHLVPVTDKDKKGAKYRQWVEEIKALGYEYKYRILNSADFGAHTSRKRYFGIFAKRGLTIAFPKQTHAKGAPLESGFEPWKPVREVLDLDTAGESIFGRKKPLCESTLKRIAAGLRKFVLPNCSDAFIDKYYGRSNPSSISAPLPTITTVDRFSVVTAEWLIKYLSNNSRTGINRGRSLEEPIDTISTQGRFGLATAQFIDGYKTRTDAVYSLEKPLPTLDTLGCRGLVTVKEGAPAMQHCLDDSPAMKEIKDFCLAWGIGDIRMRMLSVEELKRAQGFPDDYQLSGNQRNDKKFIGNSVVPRMMTAIVSALHAANC